ncbi:FecR family protein [Sphingobacterium athyrii]|uniref:Anti-sigma factor n=1 Tax=Sphingobacterium athyrii TaxID=2152717 RepID=A0A363NMS7_9SPHI|nr:FecR family protein [Sphingobacterium athyrii]PUV22119.1 anti-sigma factor [Sphingobacterium athyrii]
MKQVKELYRLISSFLSRAENIEERKQLFDWFDQQSADQIPEEQLSDIQQNVRNRLLNEIGTTERTSTTLKYLQYIGTSAAVLLIGFFAYNLWPSTENIASEELLASVPAGKERAFITLGNGKKIDLEQLNLNQHIQTGDVIIIKDGNGQISYHDAKSNKPIVQKNSMHTPKGATYDLTLSDGTLVTLNAESKITYPTSFTEGNRIVELQGEAYFHVRKTSNKSKFIVKTKDQHVEVLGTQFNINAYPETGKIQTSLAEGSVLVSLEKNNKSRVRLLPNEQAVLKQGGLSVHKIDIEEALSWKNGQFYFNGNNTAEVLQQIARWYNITITYKANSNKEQYSGKIPRNLSLDKLIKLLNFADLNTKAVLDKNNKINLIIT